MLGGMLGACALTAFGALPARRVRAADAIETSRIADDVYVLRGAGGNVLVRATTAGQVLVDSGAAAATEALLAALRALPGERVHTLFNSHWHLDQVGGNAALGAAGAVIVGHVKTLAHLSTPYYLVDEERYQQPLPPAGRPARSFYTKDQMTVGGVNVDYGYLLEAHTDGDIFVLFADRNVIAVGDAVAPARDPELDWFGGGWLGGRVDSLELLLDMSDARTRFVPSYGPVVGRAEVAAEHEMLLTVFERMVELVRQGMTADDVLEAGALDGLSRKFEDPRAFLYSAHKGLWAHHNKLNHDVV
jgi:glyoxylase-like metal-dependent hydrolase (beta-lactamase superfamily II)